MLILPWAEKAGLSDDKLLAVLSDYRTSFNDTKRLVIELADEMTDTPRECLGRFADLDCAPDRCFRSISKHQRAAVPGRQAQEFASCFGQAELFGATDNLLQRFELFTLLVNKQLRVTHDVDEQDVPDLELHI
jgi:hypothetical protein